LWLQINSAVDFNNKLKCRRLVLSAFCTIAVPKLPLAERWCMSAEAATQQ
jgi:hypothetical protein